MADTYSANLKLATPAAGDPNWNNELDRNRAILDGQNGIGDLAVTTHEQPSSSLLIDIAAGLFRAADGTVATYAGALGVAVTASTTTSVYLTGAGVLTMATTGFPALPALYVPLAVVVSGVSAITSVSDARVAYAVIGTSSLAPAGGTLADGAYIAVGTGTGTKIGTAVTQKLGFFGHAPVAQPAMGVASAGATYGANEQTMLGAVYAAVRALGLGS
jgi:hypothetical protein